LWNCHLFRRQKKLLLQFICHTLYSLLLVSSSYLPVNYFVNMYVEDEKWMGDFHWILNCFTVSGLIEENFYCFTYTWTHIYWWLSEMFSILCLVMVKDLHMRNFRNLTCDENVAWGSLFSCLICGIFWDYFGLCCYFIYRIRDRS